MEGSRARAQRLLSHLAKTKFQRARELLFFGEDDFGDAVGGLFELGIGGGHFVADGVDHFVEEGLFLAEEAAVTDAAAHDFTQDVAAAFVGG